MKLLIINGPNLNMLGIREPELYGKQGYAALVDYCRESCGALGLDCEVFQSNHEGVIVDKIQSALGSFDGIVINPAAYTHTSVAILDALKAVALPAVEVHLTDVTAQTETETAAAGTTGTAAPETTAAAAASTAAMTSE